MSEIQTHFGRCRCCFEYGYLKNMWEEYKWHGEKEIYIEMLVQCFALSWEHSHKSKEHDQICENCVSRLRDASNFKKTILESQERLLECINEESELPIKIENPDHSYQEYSENDATATGSVYIEDQYESEYVDPDEPNDGHIYVDVDYEEVEYLEIEENKEAQSVHNEEITAQEASEEYNIPGNTMDPNETEIEVKIENMDDSYQEYCENEALATASGYIDDPGDPDYVELDEPNDSDVSNDMVYEEVEYLELDDNKAVEKATTGKRSKRATVTPPTRKWPRKLPKAERYKTYKQYTQEDLRKCLEAVRNEELTPQEASEKYGVPRKTISAKSKLDPNDKQEASSNDNKVKMYQMIQELKTILTYTNATPYKYKAQRYYCLYCSTDGPYFREPDELRVHTRTKHVTERTTKIEFALRPHWMNETVKLDIENFICNVCCIALPTWNEMFRHLKEQHEIVLDIAYSRIIPYVLSSDLKCALCKEAFTNYMQLDGHMNSHYDNYVCDDCGDTYLAANRLKQHKKIHEVGRYSCSFCSKVFTLDKYRKKHIELVHKQTAKFKCWYCEERFPGEYPRHVHTVEKHNDKIKVITCELCGKTFTWRAYYVKHMKHKHSDDPKKCTCQECGKKFFQPYALRQHMLKHTGQKQFHCQLCDKKFGSAGSLKHHYESHKKHAAVQIVI